MKISDDDARYLGDRYSGRNFMINMDAQKRTASNTHYAIARNIFYSDYDEYDVEKGVKSIGGLNTLKCIVVSYANYAHNCNAFGSLSPANMVELTKMTQKHIALCTTQILQAYDLTKKCNDPKNTLAKKEIVVSLIERLMLYIGLYLYYGNRGHIERLSDYAEVSCSSFAWMCKNPSELNKFKRLLYEAKKFIVAIASLRPCYGIRKNIVQVFSEAGGVGWKDSDRLFSEAQSFLASVVFLGSILYELVIVLGGNIVFNDRIHKHFPVIPYEECLLFKILELYGYPKKCITLEDLNQAFIPEVVGDFLFIAKGIGCIYPIKGRVHVKHHAVEIESVL